MNSNFSYKGFTLLELILVIAILAILTVAGVSSYRSFGNDVQIKGIAQILSGDLRQAQSNSMIGVGGFKWGIHFVNGTNDYYQLFSTPDVYSNIATVIVSTTTLPSNMSFSDPISGNTKDVIFSKISGATSATSTTIVMGNLSKTISISNIGTIDNQ